MGGLRGGVRRETDWFLGGISEYTFQKELLVTLCVPPLVATEISLPWADWEETGQLGPFKVSLKAA